MKKYIFISLFFILLGPVNSIAEILGTMQAGTYTFGLHGGGYLYEGNQNLGGDILYGLNLGYNLTDRLGLEFRASRGDFKIRIRDKKVSTWPLIDEDIEAYIFNLDLLYHLKPRDFRSKYKILPYVLLGVGDVFYNDDEFIENDNYPMFNYGLGIKLFYSEKIMFRFDARHVITYDDSYEDRKNSEDDYKLNNNLYYTAGISFIFGEPKAKAVKVKVKKEEEILDITGKAWDSDNDGVIEADDKCPQTPLNVEVDDNGCPLDTDNDGVYDFKDDCPDTPEGVPVKIDGCPRDADNDGVYDLEDKCPNTMNGVGVDSDGCPVDSDGDGINDELDKCPDTKMDETVDSTGCPLKKKRKTWEKVSIKLEVLFDPGKAHVKIEYKDQIKKVADFMKEHQDVKSTIEAHTDSQGSEAYNLKLSQKRADSLRQYLIDHFNVEPERLVAIGRGESKPFADNNTVEGRKMNRRAVAIFSAIDEKWPE